MYSGNKISTVRSIISDGMVKEGGKCCGGVEMKEDGDEGGWG